MKRTLSKVILGVSIIVTLFIPAISNINAQNIGSFITPYIQWPDPNQM
ncbi:hypothetical protein [Clostridium sp. C8-1-8]|nr:hypothetical protein [Clostridium sp. C8-1-8]